MEAFKDENEFVKQTIGHPIYCGDLNNYPVKTHHINGSCQNYCICTSNLNGKIYKYILPSNCLDDFCCIIENKHCVDPVTNKIKFESKTKYSTPGAEVACANALNEPNCYGFNIFLYNEFNCTNIINRIREYIRLFRL